MLRKQIRARLFFLQQVNRGQNQTQIIKRCENPNSFTYFHFET